MSIKKVLNRAAASATGGRYGRASASDGQVELRLTTPTPTPTPRATTSTFA